MNELDAQLVKWQKLLLVYAGASVLMLATTLAELSLYLESYRVMGRVMNVNPWFGIWIVLLLACLTPGIGLLAGRAWRRLPLARRLPTALGFLACGWVALAAFDLRALPLEPPIGFHLIVYGLGAALGAFYLIWRRTTAHEELFP